MAAMAGGDRDAAVRLLTQRSGVGRRPLVEALVVAVWPHRGHQGRELQAKSSSCKGFQRSDRPSYVIDADVRAVTINDTNAAAKKKQGGDTNTAPPALRLTPEPQLD